MPRKRFGQHFLIDPTSIDRIHRLISANDSDQVLEIGPGHGSLTRGLIDSGADVLAIEIDSDLVDELRIKFPTAKVVVGDILEACQELFEGKRIVGNLPYGISTPLLVRLTTMAGLLDMHFMLQREVVDRMTASPYTKEWGRLSVRVQWCWDVHRLFDVGPEAFSPMPQVNSSFVRIEPLANPLEIRNQSVFDQVLTRAFGQRRKKISNSLAGLELDWDAIGIDHSLRADQLNVEQYVAIANVFE